jgi:hypothetical protein
MRSSAWGGGIELAACASNFGVKIHVWERFQGGFKRISCFQAPRSTGRTINVLYCGGIHYDYLDVFATAEELQQQQRKSPNGLQNSGGANQQPPPREQTHSLLFKRAHSKAKASFSFKVKKWGGKKWGTHKW